jgi:hypothetical protein
VPLVLEPAAALSGAPAADAGVLPSDDGLVVPELLVPLPPPGVVPDEVLVLDPALPAPVPVPVAEAASVPANGLEVPVEDVVFPVASVTLVPGFSCLVASLVVAETALETFLTALPVIALSGVPTAALDDADADADEAAGGEYATAGAGAATAVLPVPEDSWTAATDEAGEGAAARAWWTRW